MVRARSLEFSRVMMLSLAWRTDVLPPHGDRLLIYLFYNYVSILILM